MYRQMCWATDFKSEVNELHQFLTSHYVLVEKIRKAGCWLFLLHQNNHSITIQGMAKCVDPQNILFLFLFFWFPLIYLFWGDHLQKGQGKDQLSCLTETMLFMKHYQDFLWAQWNPDGDGSQKVWVSTVATITTFTRQAEMCRGSERWLYGQTACVWIQAPPHTVLARRS